MVVAGCLGLPSLACGSFYLDQQWTSYFQRCHSLWHWRWIGPPHYVFRWWLWSCPCVCSLPIWLKLLSDLLLDMSLTKRGPCLLRPSRDFLSWYYCRILGNSGSLHSYSPWPQAKFLKLSLPLWQLGSLFATPLVFKFTSILLISLSLLPIVALLRLSRSRISRSRMWSTGRTSHLFVRSRSFFF